MCYKKGEKNILGTELVPCSLDPLTGFYRDGFCKSFESDTGEHTVCAKVTKEFLLFSKNIGNDLITPRPEYNFIGLNDGDNWCLCANRWIEALHYDIAPDIFFEATHISFLKKISFQELKKFSIELKNVN